MRQKFDYFFNGRKVFYLYDKNFKKERGEIIFKKFYKYINENNKEMHWKVFILERVYSMILIFKKLQLKINCIYEVSSESVT